MQDVNPGAPRCTSCTPELPGAVMLVPIQMTERTVKAQYLACNPERQFNHAEQLRKTGDSAGLHAFTTGALLSGTCISLNPGMAVFRGWERESAKVSSGSGRKAPPRFFTLRSWRSSDLCNLENKTKRAQGRVGRPRETRVHAQDERVPPTLAGNGDERNWL